MTDPGPIRPADLLFPGRRDAITSDTCVCCGQPAAEFKDALSRKEFRISGLCQSCQDATFRGED